MSLKNKEFKEGNLAVYVMTHGPECTWLDDYCIPMELGAAKRDNLRYTIRDDDGEDNISEKNGLYNELTGLYWMWKNDKHEFVGLYHYRRIFNLSRKEINNILKEKDAIVGIINHKKNIEDAYMRWHLKEDWNIFQEELIRLYPQYEETSRKYFQQEKIIVANMFITKQEILQQYYQWIFPLLRNIEERLDLEIERTQYNKRAIGFIAERAFGLWIIQNNLDIAVKKVWKVPPYFLTEKCPKFIEKIITKNLYIHNFVIYLQDKVYSIIIRFKEKR